MKLRLLLVGTIALVTAPAQAWNARGHMVVAAIAWDQMTPAARARAHDLLKLNPDYETWVAGVAEADRGKIAFVNAATWPDDIRGRECDRNGQPPGCYTNDGYEPDDAGDDLNIGYADHRLRKYWHFKDIPFSRDGTPLVQPFEHNAETQIEAFLASLTDQNVDDPAKSFNLSWLIHLVGDVHQPLHATSRISANNRDGDSGGNDVKICLPAAAQCDVKHSSSLHTFWDGAIGTSRLITSAITKAATMPAASGTAQIEKPPAEWVQESFRLAKSVAYQTPIGPQRKQPFRLTTNYRVKVGSTAETRISLAGARLARVLNERLED